MTTTVLTPPREPYLKLFLRFLRFGLMAWGGPVAQIAMIRRELVDEEAWVSSERFNRVLAVYQVLPGPEAHELCVYFGMLSRGRIGGLLAGLGFMLPGFLLMLLLSWMYVTFSMTTFWFAGAFYGMQPAVAALIVRAIQRIGGHALHDRWLWLIAAMAFVAQLAGVHFAITLIAGGLAYVLSRRNRAAAYVLIAAGAIGIVTVIAGVIPLLANPPETGSAAAAMNPSWLALFWSGLRSGLLTFGGAYTVIPFLQNDAVSVGRWMTNSQFLDGLALSGILPAPLVIFGTFVGYLGGGPWGAVAVTLGIFLPAFSFTLIGHDWVERLVENTALHNFLDGVTAGVVGLISATALLLLRAAITDLPALGIFAAALLVLIRWKSRMATPVVVLGAAGVGLLLSLLLQ